MSPFQQREDAASAYPAIPADGGLATYDPAARVRRPLVTPQAALTDMPAISIRIMRWLGSALITVGFCMIAARRVIRRRLRRSEEAGTVAARRMLEETVQPGVMRAAPVPPRRIQWTAERIDALNDANYARLCAGFWETRGYEARVEHPHGASGYQIELHRMPDRKALQGLVLFLPQDDGRCGVDALRRLDDVRRHRNIAVAAIMTRGALSEEAHALAGQLALQAMDQSALLNQLRLLSQDQQEALFAELNAYMPSGFGISIETPAA